MLYALLVAVSLLLTGTHGAVARGDVGQDAVVGVAADSLISWIVTEINQLITCGLSCIIPGEAT